MIESLIPLGLVLILIFAVFGKMFSGEIIPSGIINTSSSSNVKVNKLVNDKIGKIAGLAVLIMIVFTAAFLVGDMVGPAYEFQDKVHSHVENAYYAADPYTMRSELLAARQGMDDLGLTSDMSAKFFYWQQTPDWSMEWQYQHIDSVLTRCEEFIAWSENNTGEGQQYQDVYSQKLDNVRAFLRSDGWSDEISKGAFYMNVHVFYGIYGKVLLVIGWIVTALLVIARFLR